MFRKIFSLLVVFTLHFTLYTVASAAPLSARINLVSGPVEIKIGSEAVWKKAEKDLTLNEKDEIRTGAGGRVVLLLSNGGRISLQENSNLALNELQEDSVQVAMNAGTMNVKVKKMGAIGKFQVGTPASVCAVRGTNFKVKANEKETEVECYRGAVGVIKSGSFEETTLSRWEKITVSEDGPLGSPINMSKDEIEVALTPIKEELSQEVSMGMSREAVQSAAAQEIKLAEYQQGKSLIDAFGYRVRLEEYIVRPQADQFKMVVLNERENRFDYFTWKATFNKDLPTDLTEATKWLDWTEGTKKPDYWLTENESAISNTVDIMKWKYWNGDVRPTKEDPNKYKHFFDNFAWEQGQTSNMIEKISWIGSSLQSYTDRTWYILKNNAAGLTLTLTESEFQTRDANGNLDGGWLKTNLTVEGYFKYIMNNEDIPDNEKLYTKLELKFPDNTKYSEEYYTIDNEGNLLTFVDFEKIYTELQWNQETVFKATEFKGQDGKIDFVVEPKIFADAGAGIPSD